jgi:hypothetical protein
MLVNELTGYDIKSRISNNPVENWFGQLKHNILRYLNVSDTLLKVTLYFKPFDITPNILSRLI